MRQQQAAAEAQAQQEAAAERQRVAAEAAARAAEAAEAAAVEARKPALADVENAKAKNVPLSVLDFDIHLGEPPALPRCPGSKGDDDPLSMAFAMMFAATVQASDSPVAQNCLAEGGFGAGSFIADAASLTASTLAPELTVTSLRLTTAARPAWLHPTARPEVVVKDGIVMAVVVFTKGAPVASTIVTKLKTIYGPPTADPRGGKLAKASKRHGRRDWYLPGVHVLFKADGVIIELDTYRKLREDRQGPGTESLFGEPPAAPVSASESSSDHQRRLEKDRNGREDDERRQERERAAQEREQTYRQNLEREIEHTNQLNSTE